MPAFSRSSLPKIHQRLSRDTDERQILKLCYTCGKGFCKRKGRGKAASVANAPGRYVCAACLASPSIKALPVRNDAPIAQALPRQTAAS